MPNIRRLLKALGKSQSWLARVVGVSTATMSLYCSGKCRPGPDVAGKLARALRCSLEDLDIRPARRTGPHVSPIDLALVRSKMAEFTVAELARRARISRQALFAILTGEAQPQRATVRRLAKVLGVAVEELTGFEAADQKKETKPARLKRQK
jgi:transcriptional regulator with XRE-family HTH domain